MGIIRKQSTYTTIILYTGIIVGFIGSALIRPKILSEGEIGLLQIVLNTTALFAGVFTLGANLTTLKMFPRFQIRTPTRRGSVGLASGRFNKVCYPNLTYCVARENNCSQAGALSVVG